MALSTKEIKQEEEFLKGVPRLNIAAFVLPPIWGPAHGLWVSIIFYPLWLIADNVFYAAYSAPSAFSIAIAIVVFVILLACTIGFSLVGQPYAAHRAAARGIGKQEYLKRQRIWAVVCILIGILMIALATYFNLVLRTEV